MKRNYTKNRLSRRLFTFGTALMLSALTIFPAFAVEHSGHLDTVSDTAITGWAWDKDAPDTAVTVELTISGESFGPAGGAVYTVPAEQTRPDLAAALGSSNHGFQYSIDWSKFASGTYTVAAAAVSGETKTPLIGTFTYEVKPQTVIGPSYAAGPGSANTSGPSFGPGSSPAGPGAGAFGPGATSIEYGEADQFLGSFQATAYCGCESCSGGHTLTYSGTVPQANHTIAADLEHYPIGTKLLINGIVYTVEDKGTHVQDQRIDIYFATHEEALAFGLQTVDVYSVK